MKILITTYYGLIGALLYAAKTFNELGIHIIDYPLFRYAKDIHDKKINYVNDFIDCINRTKPDYILWWYIGIDAKDINHIAINTNVKHILFNWDDPFDWEHNNLSNKVSIMQHVFITSQSNLNRYINAGAKKVHYLLPAYEPRINHPILNTDEYDEYKCDISICCTNLYNGDEYSNQYINRKEIIDKIYNNQQQFGYTFNIYGPEWLKYIYPNSYKKNLQYEELNIVFNLSKINICTHVCNSQMYLNERAILVLGSGGLLFVDNIDGIRNILMEDECVIFDKETYFEKIIEILNNYNKYFIRRFNGHVKSKEYTYKKWCAYILKQLDDK